MRVYRKKRLIILGREDTRAWESGSPDGARLREQVRQAAQKMADEDGRYAQVNACQRAGGWTADIIYPNTDDN
jgi:hypothetical protein